MPRVNGLSGIIEVSKMKEITFGPYIPGFSDEEDSIDSSAEDEQVAKVEEKLITFEQDELREKVAADSAGEKQPDVLLKLAAQIFMEEKAAADSVKKKIAAKLALLEEEVKIGHQLLFQSKTLVKSQEALLLKKVRVTYNKCHSFLRGKVVSAHRSFVDEQVAAAKARLGLTKNSSQFNIPAMVAVIDKLAPEGKYLSSKPAPAPAATSRARKPLVKKEKPSVRYFTAPVPSMPIQQRSHRSSHSTTAAQPGYRGDQSIVSNGDALAEEPYCDISTQLEHSADEYLWDGVFDFSYYEEEVDVNLCGSDVDCFDAEEEVAYYDAEEVDTCFEAEDEPCYFDAEVDECGYNDEDFYAY